MALTNDATGPNAPAPDYMDLAEIAGALAGFADLIRIHVNVHGAYLPDGGREIYRHLAGLDEQVARLRYKYKQMIRDRHK